MGTMTARSFASGTSASAIHLDLGCKQSLMYLCRPEMGPAIAQWMNTAGETEKRGVIRLARMASPNLLQPYEKPRTKGAIPACAVAKGQYTNPLTGAATNLMARSASSPMRESVS